MNYLRTVKIEQVWEHAGIDWKQALPGGGPRGRAPWTIATPVRDEVVGLSESRLYKSIRDECNDAGKRASLLNMLNQLRYAACQDDYQALLKNSNVQVKEAFGFEYRSKKQKVWELKFQNKDRLYFFTYRIADKQANNLLVLLLFHHKKDQTTPKQVREYCEKAMKPYLDPNPDFKILEEKP